MFENNTLLLTGCMGSIGLIGLVVGILVRLGVYKSLFAMKGNPAFAPDALAYIGIPGSLLFFLIASLPFWPSVEARRNFALYVIFPYQFFLIVLAVWRPIWLKPKWLRWIEQRHSDIIEILWADIRADRWGWERRVRTQEQLEEWVREVRHKQSWFNRTKRDPEMGEKTDF